MSLQALSFQSHKTGHTSFRQNLEAPHPPLSFFFFFFNRLSCSEICVFPSWPLGKRTRIEGNYTEKADIYQCLRFGTLNGPADNFPL